MSNFWYGFACGAGFMFVFLIALLIVLGLL